MKPVIRKETVELVCNTGSTLNSYVSKFNFQDNENLRNVKLWGVQLYYDKIFKSSLTYPSAENYPTLPTKSQFQRMFLSLYDVKDNNFLKDAPFPIFQSIENGTMQTSNAGDQKTIQEKDFKFFTGQQLDLQKSSISIITIKPLSFTAVIDFYYSRIDLDKI